MEEKDIVYVVASELGSIGMGTTAQKALEGIEKSGLNYKAFSRGYKKSVSLDRKNLSNYSFLEYFSFPFRAIQKIFGIKFDILKKINIALGKLIKRNLPKAKIYHTWIYVAPEAILKAKKCGVVMILEGANSHPMNVAKIMNKEYSKNNMKEYIANEKQIKEKTKIYEDFDYVMCPSDFVYNSFLEQGFDKKRLIKMPYGVDIKRFSVKKNYPKKGDKIKFVFVGSIQLRKGMEYLLEAWKELNLRNAELIIVGRVWPDAQKVISDYKNLKGVKFVGFAKPEKILKECDVFISPSLEEGSALTCYEAMASGSPLIATYNTGSIARNKKEGFIIEAGNVEALKEKIKYFYDNPKQIEKMGKSARRYVEKFTWEKYGERLSGFYKEVLGMKPIKVKFDVGNEDYKNRFVYKTLFENFEVREIEKFEEADLIIATKITNENKKYFFDRNKKTIFVSHENLLFRRNLFSLLEKVLSGIGLKKKKYKVLDFLDSITPKFISSIPLGRFMKYEFDYLKRIEKNKLKYSYAIVGNGFSHRNILKIPLFIQNDFYKIENYLKVNAPSKKELQKKKFCAFVVSSNSSRERIQFFKKLSKYKKIDSYGRVLNNTGNKFIGKDYNKNPSFLKDYKFVVCFENSFADEYITEKLPNAILANYIPIYRGAPNISKYFNTKSFINYEDYGSYESMIKKIIEIDEDNEKYLEFLKEPCFVGNVVPSTIKNKKKELEEFYRKVLE